MKISTLLFPGAQPEHDGENEEDNLHNEGGNAEPPLLGKADGGEGNHHCHENERRCAQARHARGGPKGWQFDAAGSGRLSSIRILQGNVKNPQDNDPRQHEKETDDEQNNEHRLQSRCGDCDEAGKASDGPQERAKGSSESAAVGRFAIDGPGGYGLCGRYWRYGRKAG